MQYLRQTNLVTPAACTVISYTLALSITRHLNTRMSRKISFSRSLSCPRCNVDSALGTQWSQCDAPLSGAPVCLVVIAIAVVIDSIIRHAL